VAKIIDAEPTKIYLSFIDVDPSELTHDIIRYLDLNFLSSTYFHRVLERYK